MVVLAAMVLFVACDKQDDASKGFNITSGTKYSVEASGGDVYITYEGAEQVTAKAISGEEAVKSIITPTKGVVVVSFKVNNTNIERVAVVEVRAGEEYATLVFTQSASNSSVGGGEDVTFNALSLDGYYYGEKYGEGSDRFAFFLSDAGLNNAGQAYTNSTYYYIDCFAPVTGSPVLPEGMYLFDTKNTGAPNTINSVNSQLMLTGNSVEDTEIKYLENATMMVSANKIVLEVIINGAKHKVTYTGGLELKDASEGNGGNGGNNDPTGGQEKEAMSTLTSDHNVTFDGEHRVKWVYEGDYWQTGYSNYTVMMMNKANGYVYGDTLQLDIITDNTSKDGDIYGTYTCSYSLSKNTLVAGFTNDYAQAVGTWLFDYNMGGASYNGYAMIVDGTLVISDAGNGNSSIILDAVDCHGNKITCNWTGVIEED